MEDIDLSPKNGMNIQDASAWILRVGVIVSVTVMLAGVLVSFHHNNIEIVRMEHSTFDSHPSVIWQGLRQGRGKALLNSESISSCLRPSCELSLPLYYSPSGSAIGFMPRSPFWF